MKRLISLAVLLLIAVTSFAHDFEVDGIYYVITSSSSDSPTVSVSYKGTSYTSYSKEYTGNVTIPETVTYSGVTYSVTSIGNYAFRSCSGLTNVTIPNSVTNIGDYAFYYCSKLTSVTIPSSITSIGASAFYDCSGLTSINIGNSVKTIGSYAFQHCTELKRVIVKDIAAWCNITFGDKNVSNPLYYAHSIYSDENTEITHLVIPENVKSINAYAFVGCTGLKSVTFESSDITVDRNAFYQCAISEYYIPKGSYNAFKGGLFEDKLYIEKGTRVYEIDGGKVWAETLYGYPEYFTTCYDYDGDGQMDFLSYDSGNLGFYGKDGTLKSIVKNNGSNTTYAVHSNANGDFLFYENATNKYIYDADNIKIDNGYYETIADIDNDGRKDLVERYAYKARSFPIYFQQADGTYKSTEQAVTLDETAVEAENNRRSTATMSVAKGMFADLITPILGIDNVKAIDLNGDGIQDLLGDSGVLYSYADNKYFANLKGGKLTPCDLDGDGEFEYVGYDGEKLYLMSRGVGNSINEKLLFTKSDIKYIACNDFDHDGDIDILAYINTWKEYNYNKDINTYFVFFRNDGEMSFKRKESNFSKDYRLKFIKDVDADGLYEMVAYDKDNDQMKLLKIGADLSVTDTFEKGYYAISQDESFTSGSSVTQGIVKLTFGETGGADFTAAITDRRIGGEYFTSYTAGNGVNGEKAGGTFYTLESERDCKLTIGVVLNYDKKFYIEEDGVALADYNGITTAEKYYGTYTIDAKAGKKYKMYCRGSKLGLYGFSYVTDGIDMSDKYSNGNIAVGDFDNDGIVDYRYPNVCKTNVNGAKYGIFSTNVNTAPEKMEKPTAVFDEETQRLRINWKQGTDKETSSCDLTYELRIGTDPASGNVLFGASLADGTRRTPEKGNMGRLLSTLFNSNSLKPGKYYISVQAVDAGGRGGAWSDDFVYEHKLTTPIIVSNYITTMSTADPICLSVKTPIDGAEYKWTVSEGKQIDSNGSDARFVFEHDGKHTVNLAMTYDGRTLNAEPLTINVEPATFDVKSELGIIDLNQDGYPEYFAYVNDGTGKLEKVLKSYVTDIPGGSVYMDYNMDGFPDVISKNNVYINLGEQDNDFEMNTQTFEWVEHSYTYDFMRPTQDKWFDANNDGYLDNWDRYNDGTNIVWRPYEFADGKYASYYNAHLEYDVNRDGMIDFIYNETNRWYVMYKDSTANFNYTAPQLLFAIDESVNWNRNFHHRIEDVNNDGYADLIVYDSYNAKLAIVKGRKELPCNETVVYDFKNQIRANNDTSLSLLGELRDYNNDGYLEMYLREDDGTYRGAQSDFLIKFGNDFSAEIIAVSSEYENGSYADNANMFMVQGEGGYPNGAQSRITNMPPFAPAAVAAKQTKDGMLITWSDAEDDHTPAMQMRYNISVKRKDKKGDNSFVISPMNGLKDAATICGTIMYKKSTQMLVPASVLTAGETYEIQVQAIDLWNQHSPMTKAVEFTMTSNGYIDVCEQVATDKETTVKFVGTQAGNYSLNAGDGATIVSDKGNGEYTVKWATEGVKDIMLTAGDATVKSSVTVVKPIDLAFTVPTSVFAKAPLTIEVSDEMAKAAKNVGLRCSDSKVKIDYVIGSKTADVTFPATGTYTLEAYSTDEVNGNTYSQVVKVTADMPKAIISQVDVDAATGSYAVCWETDALPAGISKVVVSKEGSRSGQFNEIGTVNVASGRYVDLSSNTSVMASRYSIRLIADNGQKSDMSIAHQPLHVMIAKAVKGYNLIWNSYEGLNVESYGIMRGSTPENMQMIEQVAGNVNSYTDMSAPAGVSYYAVTFEAQKDAPHQNSLNTVTGTGTEDAVSSNIISTEDAVDIVEAQSLELIVLDEDATLNDGHKELQLYYMILPTYATISKVKWEITGGSDIATIDANGVLHATGGDGTVKVRVATLDGSDLSAEISVPCSVFIDDDPTSVKIEEASTETTLKEKRYFTIDGKQIATPVSGQPYVEWSIYSNGQIVSRKVMKR